MRQFRVAHTILRVAQTITASRRLLQRLLVLTVVSTVASIGAPQPERINHS
jgi:hypothetical protein